MCWWLVRLVGSLVGFGTVWLYTCLVHSYIPLSFLILFQVVQDLCCFPRYHPPFPLPLPIIIIFLPSPSFPFLLFPSLPFSSLPLPFPSPSYFYFYLPLPSPSLACLPTCLPCLPLHTHTCMPACHACLPQAGGPGGSRLTRTGWTLFGKWSGMRKTGAGVHPIL